jgi:hypothetical protein
MMMMKTILDIVERSPGPAPWSEGDNIPWNDPEFSERMLTEHLSQEHDLASRRSETIDQRPLLPKQTSRAPIIRPMCGKSSLARVLIW